MNNTIYWPYEQNEFFRNKVIGKTIVDIKGASSGNDHISFLFSDGTAMKMFHSQSCCESVEVDDICGDIEDLIGSPVLGAEERESVACGARDEYDSSYTWTFYTFRTQKGYVDIRWYGTSNGYYSEGVDIEYYDPNANNDWEKCFEN